MRHKIREQSYVDPELLKQVQAYEAAKGCTHTAFTKEAYERFLATERGDADIVGSRLDTLTQRLERNQHTLDLLAMTFARFAEVWCRYLPAEPQTPESVQRGEHLYGRLMRGAADKFRAGRRLIGEVFPATGDRVPPRPGSGPVGGSGGGKGPIR
jgi:hypothetical protein